MSAKRGKEEEQEEQGKVRKILNSSIEGEIETQLKRFSDDEKFDSVGRQGKNLGVLSSSLGLTF